MVDRLLSAALGMAVITFALTSRISG